MEWFCLDDSPEQDIVTSILNIPNPEVLCNIKLDVVLNIRKSTNSGYDHDIKDEISKTCKDYQTKKMFEKYLKELDKKENVEGMNSLDKEQAVVKLGSFDAKIEKNLGIHKSVFLGSESKTDDFPGNNISKLIGN